MPPPRGARLILRSCNCWYIQTTHKLTANTIFHQPTYSMSYLCIHTCTYAGAVLSVHAGPTVCRGLHGVPGQHASAPGAGVVLKDRRW